MVFKAGTKGKTPRNRLLFGAGAALFLLLSCILCAHPSQAGPTPAGILIKNQTTASFEWEGKSYSINSNLVTTQVDPVYGIEIIPSGDTANPALSARTQAGGTVLFPYLLTNTGNTADSFLLDLPFIAGMSSFEPHLRAIYIDSNGNGILEPGESANVFRVDNVAAGESVHILVSVPVPANRHPGDICFLDLTGASVGDPSKTDTGNVCRVTVGDGPMLRLWKTADVTEVLPGNPVAFTLGMVNIGGAPASMEAFTVDGIFRTGIAVTDAIPDYSINGARYAAGSLTGVPAGVRLFSTNGGLTWTALGEPAASLVTNVGYLFETPLAVGQSARVNFSIVVDPAHDDDPLRNSYRVRYGDGTGTVFEENSNVVSVDVKVGQSPSDPNDPLPEMLVIGPHNNPAAVGTADLTGDGNITDNDDETVDPGLPAVAPNLTGTQVAGNIVKFLNTIRNTSSVTGVANITVDSLTNFPAGWIARLFQADGVTTLMDTNGDNIADTGPLAPGAQKTIAVLVYIPNDQPAGDNNGQGFRAVIRASWAANPNIFNLTHDTIPRVIVIGSLWDPFMKDEEGPPVVNPGTAIPYVNTFGNVGPGEVYNAYIRDELSGDLTNVHDITTGTIYDISGTGVAINVTGTYSAVTHIVTWYMPVVPAGFTGQVRFKADVAPGVADGTEIPNVFTITSDSNLQVKTSNLVANVVGGDRILTISKKANIQKASVGDPILYTIEVENKGADPISQALLTDRIPKGFRYVKDTARIDGKEISTEADANGTLLSWNLGILAPKSKAVITCVLVITPDAPIGDAENTANVSGRLPLGARLSFSDSAVVKVEEGVFTQDSVIIGKVFIDQNGNRIQDESEPGVGNVRLYLEDGTFVITDREGKYHIDGVKPGMHNMRLDESTLPSGHVLGVLDVQNAGNPASRFVELSYGTIHKANFRVLEKPEDTQSRGPAKTLTLLPITLCKDGDTLRVTITVDGLVSATHYLDPQTGEINVHLPGVTVNSSPAIMELVEGNVKAIRTEVDETQNLTKVQIILRKRTTGYPIHLVNLNPNGAVVDVGLKRSPDADPEELPTPHPAPDTLSLAEIYRPVNGESYISRSAITVEAGTALSAQFELLVNGVAVDKDRIGKKTYDTKVQRARYEYVGVPLEKGKNTLRFEAVIPGSGKKAFSEITVFRSDDPKEMSVTMDPENLMADARTEPVLRVSLLDENKIPTAVGAVITASVDRGDILTPDLRPMEPGIQVTIRDGAAQLRLSAASSAEIRTVTIKAGDFERQVKVQYKPFLRDWIVTGVASGVVSGTDSKDADTDGGAKDSDTDFSGRTAVFVKGKLPADVSLTAAYDSEKDRDTTAAFQEKDPMRYYPVFGDESRPQYEARSRDKLFVKMERNTSYGMYGDFRTEMDRTDLAAYDRALTGAKLHVESPYVDIHGFFARNDQAQVKAEIPGDGTSGYYHLPDAGLIENTEQIVIETRDRNFPDNILSTQSLTRFTDYTIDYERGRILFKKPVASFDENFNPVFIVIRYEVDSRENKDYNTYGGRASVHTRGRRIELGASFIRDEGFPADHTIEGVDATVRILPKVVLRGEYAESEDRDGLTDSARLVELKSTLDRAEFSLYYKDVGLDFDNPGLSGVTPGRRTMGLKGTFKVTERLKFKDELYTEDDNNDDSRRDVYLHDFVYQYNQAEFLLGGGYVTEESFDTAKKEEEFSDSAVARAGAAFDLTRKLRLTLLHQHAFGDWTSTQSTHSQLKATYAVTDATKYTVGLEGREAEDGDYNANAVAGVESTFSESLSGFARYTLEDSTDGPRGRAGVGLDLHHKVSPSVKLLATGEISQPVHSTGEEEALRTWAGTFGFEYRPRDEKSVSSGRFEVKDDENTTTYLGELSGALKVRLDHTLFARNTVQYYDKDEDENGWIADVLMGWAYRPVRSDRLNLISDMEFKYEDNIEATEGTRLNRLLFSMEAHYQPVRRVMLESKYACRQVLSGYSENTFTDVKAARLRVNATDRLFFTAGARWLSQYDTGTSAVGWGAGVGFNVFEDIQVMAGYNFEGFEDEDFSRAEHWEKGWFTGIHWKFDESLFGILRRIERPKKTASGSGG